MFYIHDEFNNDAHNNMFICDIFQPLMVKNWELHVHFKVHGSGKNLFGDGFAVWYARDRNQLGKYDLHLNLMDKTVNLWE